jgi:lactate 2-monooxygenase
LAADKVRPSGTRLAIVGGGATAVVLLDALDRAGVQPPFHVSVYEPRPVPGPGRPYGEDVDDALINRPADQMSIRHAHPLDFRYWLRAAARRREFPATDPEARFQPRWLFGQYLRCRLGGVLARLVGRGVLVDFYEAAVEDVVERGGELVAVSSPGPPRAYDAVVLCLGTPRPADPYGLRGLPRFIADPYPLSGPVDGEQPVTVLGSGLSGVDLAMALLRRGHNAPIRMMSRSGLLPGVRGLATTADPAAVAHVTEVVELTPSTGLWAATRRALHRHLAQRRAGLAEMALDLAPGEPPTDRLRRQLGRVADPACWRAALLPLLDPVGELLWQRLPMATRLHLLGRINPRVAPVLNPMPQSTAETLLQALTDGRLEVIAGVTGVAPVRDGFVVTAAGREYRTATVLNAIRATHYDEAEPAGSLLARLARRGLVRQHPCGGVHIDFATNRVDGPAAGLFALGHPTAGDVYYANAGSLLGISARAERIAQEILRVRWTARPRRQDINGGLAAAPSRSTWPPISGGGHMQRWFDTRDATFAAGLAGRVPRMPANPERLEQAALDHLPAEVWSFIAHGAGSGRTLNANRRAFDAWELVPRMLSGRDSVDLNTELLGTTLTAPVMLAPIGLAGLVHPGGEAVAARTVRELGLGMILSNSSSQSLEEVAEQAAGANLWFQLHPPKSEALAVSMIQRAEKAGYQAIVVTVDSWTRGWRPADIDYAYDPFLRGHGMGTFLVDPEFCRPLPTDVAPGSEEWTRSVAARWREVFGHPSLSFDYLATLRKVTSLPILVKGIMHADDAERAMAVGVDGIVVSNHGGRQVDRSRAALDALPAVAERVGGRVPVLFDSGVRTGADACIALGLGARTVLLGRPWIYGLAIDGGQGVRHVLEAVLAELELTMLMVGAGAVSDLRRYVEPVTRGGRSGCHDDRHLS